MSKPETITWAPAPAAQDYPAALSYLSLVLTPARAAAIVALLQAASTSNWHAKDILRAARLPLLPADDAEVRKDLKRVRKGIALSPILLVRGDATAGQLLQIADGYHRVCASYHLQEDTDIPALCADMPS